MASDVSEVSSIDVLSTCGVCLLEERNTVGDEEEEQDSHAWVQCDICELWFHGKLVIQ